MTSTLAPLFDPAANPVLAGALQLRNRPLHFDGPGEEDKSQRTERLTGQIQRVYACMASGQWRTLTQIADATGDPEASVSAQLRHLRKARFGGHTVERRHIGGGLYEYRLLVRTAA
jgi:hypothetical protein